MTFTLIAKIELTCRLYCSHTMWPSTFLICSHLIPLHFKLPIYRWHSWNSGRCSTFFTHLGSGQKCKLMCCLFPELLLWSTIIYGIFNDVIKSVKKSFRISYLTCQRHKKVHFNKIYTQWTWKEIHISTHSVMGWYKYFDFKSSIPLLFFVNGHSTWRF